MGQQSRRITAASGSAYSLIDHSSDWAMNSGANSNSTAAVSAFAHQSSIEGFAACLTDDWREFGPDGGHATLDDERRTMELHRIASPDKYMEIHHIVADDDLVACHCTVTATHTGPYQGLEPTGKRVVVKEMMFNRVRDGRLAETWAIGWGAGFYEQLTGAPSPEQLDNMG